MQSGQQKLSLGQPSKASLQIGTAKSQAHTHHENLLLQSDISNDLKASTYALQLSKPNEKDLEPIRQTALVLEDILRVVTGDLEEYPY